MTPQSNEGDDQWVRATPRRRFIRYRTNLLLTVRDPQEREIDGRCEVISEGGLGGTAAEILPVGNVVRLRFAIPSPPTNLDILAVVRDQRDFQHGFEFVSLAESEKTAIRQFCSELISRSETAFFDP